MVTPMLPNQMESNNGEDSHDIILKDCEAFDASMHFEVAQSQLQNEFIGDLDGKNEDNEVGENKLEDLDYEIIVEDYINNDKLIDGSSTWVSVNNEKLRDAGYETEVDCVADDLIAFSDEEDEISCLPVFNSTDMNDVKFTLNMVFSSKQVLKDAITEYSVKSKRQIKYVKNDQKRIRVVCQDGCPFVLYAVLMNEETSWQIRTLNDNHDCALIFNNKRCDVAYLSKKFLNRFKAKPGTTLNGFVDVVKNDCASDISKWKFYRTKNLAMEVIEGTNKDQYNLLWDYCEELKRSNVGSTVILHSTRNGDDQIFRRLYIGLKACKEGFVAGCRPLIGLDGCFLKGKYGGQLLSAIGIDANNCMYPIAYAVVKTENNENWEWFVEQMIVDLCIENSFSFTIISDRQKGLIDAIKKHLPYAEHRFCVRHMYNNFKDAGHKGMVLKDKVWAAARATTIPQWQQEMEWIKTAEPTAWEWLNTKPPSQWSRSHFKTTLKCDILLNNLCEAFNKSILPARDRPIITMLEKIRNYLMTRMADKRELVKKWKHPVGPKIVEIIEKNKLYAMSCFPKWSGALHFQVSHDNNEQCVVDLELRTCSCKKWDLTGIPCTHALSCILGCNYNPFNYVDDCYKKSAYERAYNPIIMGMNGPELWPNLRSNMMEPPKVNKKAGRPKKKRKQEAGEPPSATKSRRFGMVMHCKNCGMPGHNKRRCPLILRGKKLQVKRGGKNAENSTTCNQKEAN